MAKFRYYITDTMQGEVVGTNSSEVAQCAADTEDNFVVDTETNKWIQPISDGGAPGDGPEIREQTSIVLS
jgi:hypothetical protein